MEFQELLEKRRSIRKFDVIKSATKENVEELLKAAIKSPSWKNRQATRYYCVLNEDLCNEFREKCLPQFNSEHTMGCVYIVCTYVRNVVGFNPVLEVADNELGNGWGCFDAGLQCENIILKAKELGLDTLIMGIRNALEIKKLLEIPSDEDVTCVIAVGYADTEPKEVTKKPVSEIAKFFC